MELIDPRLDNVILPRTSEITDGFKVRRALPSSRRRMVGPFIFLGSDGTGSAPPGPCADVAPHPHIGLATVTYLFDGEAFHRDSLGTRQRIRAGDVNWMTAGRGIAHSERTPPELRATGSRLDGYPVVGGPAGSGRGARSFVQPSCGEELPVIEGEGKQVRLIAGSLFGATSPVPTFSDMFYADAALDAGARLELSAEHEERAVYIVQGSVELDRDGGTFEEGILLVLKPGEPVTLRGIGDDPVRLMLLGGAAMDGPRHIWWNFVSSSRERIEQAKADWKGGRFAAVPDETEFIPLPDDKPIVARYP